MNLTIFGTPIVTQCMRWVSRAILHVTGWKVESTLYPDVKKCVLIAAPHTSNWDVVVMIMVALHLKLPMYWMGKESLCRFPFGPLMKYLGCIPIDREKRNDLVGYMAGVMSNSDKSMYLSIAPEGTRKKVKMWRTGFYHIACSASVPIACAYIDYAHKRAGIGMTLTPTGDFKEDMAIINYFYQSIQGRYPEKFSLHQLT